MGSIEIRGWSQILPTSTPASSIGVVSCQKGERSEKKRKRRKTPVVARHRPRSRGTTLGDTIVVSLLYRLFLDEKPQSSTLETHRTRLIPSLFRLETDSGTRSRPTRCPRQASVIQRLTKRSDPNWKPKNLDSLLQRHRRNRRRGQTLSLPCLPSKTSSCWAKEKTIIPSSHRDPVFKSWEYPLSHCEHHRTQEIGPVIRDLAHRRRGRGSRPEKPFHHRRRRKSLFASISFRSS